MKWFILLHFVVLVNGFSDFLKTHCEKNCEPNKNQQVNICDEICKNISEFKEIDSENLPELYCRLENQLTFFWNTEENFENFIIIENGSHWIFPSVQNNFYTFLNLTPNIEYQIQIFGVNDTKKIYYGSVLKAKTMDFSVPMPVQNIEVQYMNFSENSYEVGIFWKQNEDKSCFYDLTWYSEDGVDFGQLEIREPKNPWEAKINSLRFEQIYNISIRAKNFIQKESLANWVNVTTPTCLETFASLEKCPPADPENLQVEVTDLGSSLFDVKISWNPPEFEPDNYAIHLVINPQEDPISFFQNVPGSEHFVIFYEVELGVNYLVTVTANSTGGEATSFTYQLNIRTPNYFGKKVWIVSAITIFVLLVICFGVFTCHRRIKYLKYKKRRNYFKELEEKSRKSMDYINEVGSVLPPKFESDKWEIRPDQLLLQSVLGEGAFGLVRKGWLRDAKGSSGTEVAVKMLKDSPTMEQTRQFLQEIEIMKSVGPHPNLVSIIGCCTRRDLCRTVMLVVEFCALGDLQNYLRSAWDRMISHPRYTNVAEDIGCNLVVNKLYEISDKDSDLQPCDLLSFARQIAIGMEFLSNLKVLHRDLAARNVLVCVDKTVKVADFGLSRDVYRDNIYQKKGNSKLPIRWMAIECLTHQIYTSHSDVWSFGILLWEIVTLGGNPYPSVPTNELLKLLKTGYRMEKPANCGSELYDLMSSCWQARPKDRPSFMELKKTLDKLLESITTATYLDLEVLVSPENTVSRQSLQDNPNK